MQTPIHTLTTDCNTFEFFVELCHEPRRRSKQKDFKLVTVKQTTDFTGTELEEDFPEGSVSFWTVEVKPDFTDAYAVNLAGRKIIHLDVWQDMSEGKAA